MIPSRLPMPGGGAKVAVTAPPKLALVEMPEPPEDLVGGAEPSGGVKIDPDAPFIPPPKPKTTGRPGAPVQFSADSVQKIIRLLENAVSPSVRFTEDIAAMRVAAEKQRLDCIYSALVALKNPS